MKQPQDAEATDLAPAQPLAYTPQRFAELIHGSAGKGISERTVRSWCERRMLPGATKIGGRWIIPAATVDRLLAGQLPLPENVSLFRKQ